jgi:alpha-ribazole phosphatase/probable phosphoglycerate mutase
VQIHSLRELREVFFGDWEAISFTEIHKRFPDYLKERMANIENFHPPGNGESMGQLSARIMKCFRDILKKQRGKDFLFVGHGAVNRIILCDAMGLAIEKAFNLQQDYGCLNIIDYYEDSARVVMMNG